MAAVQVASDDFNRADGNIGANWSMGAGGEATKPTITSNQAGVTNNSVDEHAYWSANTFDIDQYAQATIKTVGGSTYSGPQVRADGNDTIWVEKNGSTNTTQTIYWYNGGAYTQLGSYGSAGYSANDVIRIEAEGTQVRSYQNGTLRITGNDVDIPIYNYGSDHGKLYAGLKFSGDTAERWDDWSGGNLYDSLRIRAFKEGSTGASVSSQNETFNIDSVDDSVLYVVIGSRDATAANLPVSSMTYNGVALTKIREDLWNSSTYVKSAIWRLINPPTGTNTLAITMAGTCAYIRPQMYHVMSNNQTTPSETDNGSNNDSGAGATTKSISVTTSTDNDILMDAFWEKDNTDPTVGTGMIIYGSTSPNAGDDRFRNSIRRVGAAGSYAMAYTWTNTDGYALSVAALKPLVAAAGGTTHFLTLLGVGS